MAIVNKIRVISDHYAFSVSDNSLVVVHQDENKKHTKATLLDLKGEVLTTYERESTLNPPELSLETADEYWITTWDYKSILVKNNQFILKNYSILKMYKDVAYVVVQDKKSGERWTKKVNLHTDEMYWERKYPAFVATIMGENLNFTYQKNDLIALNNQTDEEVWRYSLPEGEFDYIQWPDNKLTRPTIRKIIGVYREVVWFSLDSGALVGLDVKTGALVKFIVTPDYLDDVRNEEPNQEKASIFHQDVILDHEQGIIFTCIGNSYGEIDLNKSNFPYSRWSIQKELAKQPSFSEGCIFNIRKIAGWEGDTVYIFDTGMSNCFGAFDRKTRTLLWSKVFDELDSERAITLNSKYSNHHFYIQGWDQKLYIYEISEES